MQARKGLILGAALLGLGTGLFGPRGTVAQEAPYDFPGNRQPRVFTERAPTHEQMQALGALQDSFGGEIRLRWDKETGSPGGLFGRLSRPFLGSAREAALHFLSERANLFLSDPLPAGAFTDPRSSPLRVTRVTRRGQVDHVTLLQFHGALPVLRGGYTVSMRRRPGPGGRSLLEIVSAVGRCFPGIPETFETTPAVSRKEALETALEEVAPGVEPTEPPSEGLVIYPLDGSYSLAWQVDFRTSEPLGRWRVFVDALRGAILEKQNLIMHGDVSGDVWRSNPVRDATLTTFPFRDAYVTRGGVTVVTDEGGNYDDGGETSVITSLSGPFVEILNEDVPEAVYNGPPDVLWSYPVMDTHFDEINVFYHVNRFHAYLRSTLGFSGADIQLPAMVHYGDFFGNAFYDGTGIYFGDGDGFFTGNFAQDDVICHEYSHFMFDRAITMGYGFNEVGAMNEGGADYFACTFTDDSVNGEAFDLVGDIARDLDNKGFSPPRIYPDFLIANGFEPHYGGEVWGGALWDLRKALGASVADIIAWEGLFYLPPDPLFIDGRDGIVQADLDLFQGIHVRTVEQLMFERGIGPAPSTDPFVFLMAEPSFGVNPLPVLFKSIVVDNGTIQSLDWDLSDGTVYWGGGQNVSHVYTAAGSYTVTLVATDNTGATGQASLQVDVTSSGALVIRPEERDIGFVRSDQPTGNFFGDDDVFAGFLSGLDYHGAALFRLPVIPGGTSDLVVDAVTVEFTGQDDTAKGPLGGIWSLKMLSGSVDTGWRQQGYQALLQAPALFTLSPALGNGDIGLGTTNLFDVSSAQLPSLHDRVASGTVSFRMDGPYGVNNLFSWDSGYDRFREDPTAIRVKPVLRVSYTQGRIAGDVNSDGVVDGIDARLVAEAVVGVLALSPEDRLAGDVDRSGVLDERDVAAILARAAGLIVF